MTESGPQISAQGPTVEEADMSRNAMPIDMHGKLAVRTGEITIAVGRPIRKAKHV